MPEFLQNLHGGIHLALTAVAYPQVGHGRTFVFEPADASRHHLAHAREVVHTRYRLDDKLAVVALVGLAVLEGDETCHRVRAREVRNVHALDTEGGLLEAQHLLQFKDALVDFAILLHLRAHLHQNHVGVRARKLQEPELLAALRVRDCHLVARLLGKGLRERFRIRRVSGNAALIAKPEGNVGRDFARDKPHVHVPLQ